VTEMGKEKPRPVGRGSGMGDTGLEPVTSRV
jgi:hypothetical protein